MVDQVAKGESEGRGLTVTVGVGVRHRVWYTNRRAAGREFSAALGRVSRRRYTATSVHRRDRAETVRVPVSDRLS